MPKLLLAVDNENTRRVLELTFAGSAIEVATASSGDEAIARIPVERPDVVFADISLPQRSGYDVAAFIKGDPALARIRVLLLAGAFDPVDEARAAAARCDGVLAKPFEPRQVLARVNQLLGLEAGEPADPPVDHELDEYFDQLDTPLDHPRMESAASARQPDPLPGLDDGGQPLPTVARLIGADSTTGNDTAAHPDAVRETFDWLSAGDPPTGLRARPTPPADASRKPGSIADAFAALLASEQGDQSVAPVRLTPQQSAVVVGEDTIDEITRRVLARLAPGTVKDVVADVVAEVAERLVRQEIERIRKNS